MHTAQTRPSIAAVSATGSIASVQAPNAQRAARKPLKVAASAIRNVGEVIGTGKRASDMKSARLDTGLGRTRLSTPSAASALGAALMIHGALTLTTLTLARNCAQSTGNTLPAFALLCGSAKWGTCKSYAPTATASRRGKIGRNNIACERIENAQRQGRMFA